MRDTQVFALRVCRFLFVVADARTFTLLAVYDGVVCTFDSLNHIMTLDELTGAFRNVFEALHEGGLFLFDLNMEEGYQARWRGSFAIVEDDDVVIVRARYDSEERVGQYDITLFYREDGWQRTDITLNQKCYTQDEIVQALTNVEFTDIKVYDAEEDLGSAEAGRSFFVCRKRLA